MKIKKIKYQNDFNEDCALYLLFVDYDDFGYCTTYEAFIRSKEGEPIRIGRVKIGCKDIKSKAKMGQSIHGFESYSVDEILEIDPENGLNHEFYSLGQSNDYYKNIYEKFGSRSAELFEAMNDLAYNFERFQELYLTREPCLKNSLMRDLHYPNVEQFHRISIGDAELTNYDFAFSYEQSGIMFKVNPNNSTPPSNIHVLIGRNGVGKTRLLYNMVCKFLKEMDVEIDETSSSKYTIDSDFVLDNKRTRFAGIVGVSFSAFDDGFSSIRPIYNYNDFNEKKVLESDFYKKYKYIGLMKRAAEDENNNDNVDSGIKSVEDFAEEYINILDDISKVEYKTKLYLEVCRELEADAVFSEHNYSYMINDYFKGKIDVSGVKKFFKRFSSGHMIIILSLTALCNSIYEKTVVFIDEPEIHLHPPLLSTYIRTLSMLLRKRNAVGIIATHSPIVLQEVPQDCVTRVERIGNKMLFSRPNIETFASGTDQLTRDIFGYEIVKTGFYKLIEDNLSYDFDSTLDEFNNHVGSLGQIMIQGLLTRKGREEDEEN